MKEEELDQIFFEIKFISDKDTAEGAELFFKGVFKVILLGDRCVDRLTFSDDGFFEQIFKLG
jgi:hypothetical protein